MDMKCKPTSIIFLDIDGVLTNTDIDDTSFLSFDPSKYRLSAFNMSVLDTLIEASGAKIVVASNWRRFTPPNTSWRLNGKDYASTLEPFKHMYKDDIIGMLPPDRHCTKAECLSLWFSKNPWISKRDGSYVILEDDASEGYQLDPDYAKRLVMTNFHYGLTQADAQQALEILHARHI